MLDRYDQDLLLDYLEGELDADRRAQLDAILAQDPQLAALLGEMAKDRDALRSLPQADAPADLVHDVTQTLERRMLLDDTVQDVGPIPVVRGGAFDSEPARSISWGRVVGLTGLAASVALAAGIIVITLDDPLERTADHLAASDPAIAEETEIASAEPTNEALAEDAASGVAAIEKPNSIEGLLALEASEALSDDRVSKLQEGAHREALALGHVAPSTDTPTPAAITTATEPPSESPLSNPRLGSTAAISVIQPRQQLVLLTESPELTEEQLFQFCVTNGIPIVQPDQADVVAQANARRSIPGVGRVIDDSDTDVGNETAKPFTDYALLINESQLDSLVENLNYSVTIESKRAGKASLFSNQAALLADLPEEQADVPDTAQAETVAEDPDAASIEPADQPMAKLAVQQAVQLRLPPDLGSDYKNSRNAYNLKVQEQQANYSQWSGSKELATAGDSPIEAPVVTAAPAPEALGDLNKAAEDELKQFQPEADVASDREADLAAKPDELAMDAQAQPRQTEREQVGQVDPTRGNWLAAHLPMADTTPLLLHWRNQSSVSPTNLVPVRIERAEPDRVNTLRLRQQVELANRRSSVDAEAEEQPANDLSAESADAPVESEPADDAHEPSEISE